MCSKASCNLLTKSNSTVVYSKIRSSFTFQFTKMANAAFQTLVSIPNPSSRLEDQGEDITILSDITESWRWLYIRISVWGVGISYKIVRLQWETKMSFSILKQPQNFNVKRYNENSPFSLCLCHLGICSQCWLTLKTSFLNVSTVFFS